MSLKVINPPGWPRPKGYSNAMLGTGKFLFVSGQIGWDEQEQIVSDDLATQWDRALANVIECVRAAGGGPDHIARLTIYVTDKREYAENRGRIGEVFRARMGRHYPAMALVQVAALLEDRAKVEIEATCLLPEVV